MLLPGSGPDRRGQRGGPRGGRGVPGSLCHRRGLACPPACSLGSRRRRRPVGAGRPDDRARPPLPPSRPDDVGPSLADRCPGPTRRPGRGRSGARYGRRPPRRRRPGRGGAARLGRGSAGRGWRAWLRRPGRRAGGARRPRRGEGELSALSPNGHLAPTALPVLSAHELAHPRRGGHRPPRGPGHARGSAGSAARASPRSRRRRPRLRRPGRSRARPRRACPGPDRRRGEQSARSGRRDPVERGARVRGRGRGAPGRGPGGAGCSG